MQQILPLRGVIQHYDWGSRTALAELLGRSAPSERPEAELWLGAHRNGPAQVRIEGRWERLDTLIERDAEALLGARATAAFGRRLPFLLKILAVERPLSLQVHPDTLQARAGLEREQAVPNDARLYADPHGKPELICALTPFLAFCGLRSLEAVRRELDRVGLGAWLPACADESTAFRGFLGGWLGASRGAREEALQRAVAAARRTAAVDPVHASLVALSAAHPGDPGVLAPLFLHRIVLAPGEALFLPPGEIHCYLAGVAVELMASSDNVLRGGLTTKRVDVDELLRIARLASGQPPILRAEVWNGEGVWRTPASEFELSLLAPGAGRPLPVETRTSLEILWCQEGSLRIAPLAGGGLTLERGRSCLVPVAAGPYRLIGEGRAFRAALPSLRESGSPQR